MFGAASDNFDGTGLVLAEPLTSLTGTGVAPPVPRNWPTTTPGRCHADRRRHPEINSDGGTLTVGAIGGAARRLNRLWRGRQHAQFGGVIATTTEALQRTCCSATLGALNTYSGSDRHQRGHAPAGQRRCRPWRPARSASAPGRSSTCAASATPSARWPGRGNTTSTGATLTSGGNNTSTAVLGAVLGHGAGRATLQRARDAHAARGQHQPVTTISAGTVQHQRRRGLGLAARPRAAGHFGSATWPRPPVQPQPQPRHYGPGARATSRATGTLTYGGIVAGPGARDPRGHARPARCCTYAGTTTISAGVVSIAATVARTRRPTAGSLVDAASLATTATFTLDPNRSDRRGHGLGDRHADLRRHGPGALTKTGGAHSLLGGVNTYAGSPRRAVRVQSSRRRSCRGRPTTGPGPPLR